MKVSIKPINGVFDMRIWASGRGAFQARKRFKAMNEAKDYERQILKLSAFDDSFAIRFMKGEKVEQLMFEIKNPRVTNEGDIQTTFSEEFEFWYETQVSNFSPSWVKNIVGYKKEFADLMDFKISDISKSTLKQIEKQLLKKGNSQKTINMKIGFINAVLNYSLENDRIKYNPLAGYKKTKVEQDEIEFWEAEELQMFLDHANAKYPVGTPLRMIYTVYLVALSTGVRAGELYAIRASSVERDHIRIADQWDCRIKKFRKTKTRT